MDHCGRLGLACGLQLVTELMELLCVMAVVLQHIAHQGRGLFHAVESRDVAVAVRMRMLVAVLMAVRMRVHGIVGVPVLMAVFVLVGMGMRMNMFVSFPVGMGMRMAAAGLLGMGMHMGVLVLMFTAGLVELLVFMVVYHGKYPFVTAESVILTCCFYHCTHNVYFIM